MLAGRKVDNVLLFTRRILKFTKMVQRKVCVYDMGLEHKPPLMCDCKYGAIDKTFDTPHEKGCGCPEMRCLHHIVWSLTDQEYEKIMQGRRVDNDGK